MIKSFKLINKAFLFLLFCATLCTKTIAQLPCSNSFPFSGITVSTTPGFNGVTPSMAMGRYMLVQVYQGRNYTFTMCGLAPWWPNPSEQYFTLRVDGNSDEAVSIKVVDISGRQVYITKGSANKDYKLDENFISGTYIVEVRQGNKRSMIKLVKQ